MKQILLLLVLLGLTQWWMKDPSIRASNSDIRFDYIVKYAGKALKQETLPLLIALHGNGDTPDNFYESALNAFSKPARIILIKGPMRHARGSAWPWEAKDFSIFGGAFSDIVGKLSVQYPTRGKPILLGFSGGGMMAYYQAARDGDQYAAIFPVSGQLSQKMIGNNPVNAGANTKIIAFHGVNDTIIPITGAKTAIEILRANGLQPKLESFSGDHHGIFNQMKIIITQTVEQYY